MYICICIGNPAPRPEPPQHNLIFTAQLHLQILQPGLERVNPAGGAVFWFLSQFLSVSVVVSGSFSPRGRKR